MDGFGDIDSIFSMLEADLPVAEAAAPARCHPDVIALVHSVFGRLQSPADSVQLVCDVLFACGFDTLAFCAKLQQPDYCDWMTMLILTKLWPSCPDQTKNPRKDFVRDLFAEAAVRQVQAEEKERRAAVAAEAVALARRKSAAVLRRQLHHLINCGDGMRQAFAQDVQRWLFAGDSEEYAENALIFVNEFGLIRCPHPECSLHPHYYEWRLTGSSKSAPAPPSSTDAVTPGLGPSKKEQPSHQKLLLHIAHMHYGDPKLAAAEPGSTKPAKGVPRGQPRINEVLPKRHKPNPAAPAAASEVSTVPEAAAALSCF